MNRINEWLDHQTLVEQASTSGPWLFNADEDSVSVKYIQHTSGLFRMGNVVGEGEDPLEPDAVFIAEARGSVPLMVKALRDVLELTNNPYPEARNISGNEIIRTLTAALDLG